MKGVDSYLLKCRICKQCATHNIVDAWGNVVSTRTFYIEGIFYARRDEYDYVYKLLEDKQVPMLQYKSCRKLYTISAYVYECIYNTMPWNL